MSENLCPGLELPDTLGLNLSRIVSIAKLNRQNEVICKEMSLERILYESFEDVGIFCYIRTLS